MSPERITAFLMNLILKIALLLMVAGIALMVLKISPVPAETQISLEFIKESLRAPSSALFFGAAVALLLTTPVVVSFCAGIVFIAKKQFKIAAVSFLLFTMLTTIIAVQLLA